MRDYLMQVGDRDSDTYLPVSRMPLEDIHEYLRTGCVLTEADMPATEAAVMERLRLELELRACR